MAKISVASRLEKIRLGVVIAGGDDELQKIAATIGCSRSALGALIHDRRMGSRLQERVERWCKQNGYWPDEIFAVAESSSAYSAKMIAADTRCPNCGEMTPNSAFCMHCGEPMGIECPKCSTINERKDSFCRSCGVPLTLGAAEAALEIDIATMPKREARERKKAARERKRRASKEPEM
jgi:hypothetical protein